MPNYEFLTKSSSSTKSEPKFIQTTAVESQDPNVNNKSLLQTFLGDKFEPISVLNGFGFAIIIGVCIFYFSRKK